MAKAIRVISLDCETTAFSALNGWAWAVGFAWADCANDKLVTEICAEEFFIPIPKSYWNADTFQFCMKHNKDKLNELMVKAHEHNVKDLLSIANYTRFEVAPKIQMLIANLVRGLGHTEYIVVCNHPDFDIPFVERIFPDVKNEKKGGFYYRAIKDMQSLMEGHMGITGCRDYIEARKKTQGEVKHSAKEDAVAQLKTLVMSGAIKA